MNSPRIACAMAKQVAVLPDRCASSRRRRRTVSEAGFTLLEMLVVIAIMGMLIGLVAPAALRQLGNARASIAKQAIERIGTVLDIYKLDVGTYPNTKQGLPALITRPSAAPGWNGPYIKGDTAPLDPWNRSFIYRSPSTRMGEEYDLCSEGPSGSNASDSMICNH